MLIENAQRNILQADPAKLSRREREVLVYLQQGFTNRQIAGCLYVSPNTINKHVQQVLKKLQVRNRVQAAVHAYSVAG